MNSPDRSERLDLPAVSVELPFDPPSPRPRYPDAEEPAGRHDDDDETDDYLDSPGWEPPRKEAIPLPAVGAPPRRQRPPGPADGPPGKVVQCPYCLCEVDWNDAPLVDFDPDGTEVPLHREPGETADRWRHRTMNAYRVCESVGKDHFIPVGYGVHEPLFVGIAGTSRSGKSHLLAAMIARLQSEAAALSISLGLNVLPLDTRQHQRYLDRVRAFLDRREILQTTRYGDEAEFACAIKVHSAHTGKTYALTFWDVSGEYFSRADSAGVPFFGVADALLFVADPDQLDTRRKRLTGDPAFAAAMRHIDNVRNPERHPKLPVPSALVVAKSDLLRVHPEVDRWLTRDDDLALGSVERESEDAYVFLRAHGAGDWLQPVVQSQDSTLHFASAAGCAPGEDNTFPEGQFQHRRVLRPLLSLLAMKGLLGRDLLGPEGSA